MSRHVSYEHARKFLQRCFGKPERMRLLCSTKAGREGGDALQVTVEIAPGGPVVQVQEVSMADGWTGCRFSPSALWLALAVADVDGPIFQGLGPCAKAIEFGCGVALAGLAADAIGYCTSVTDCLPGHLKNLQQHPAALQGKLEVFRLDWIDDVGAVSPGCAIDLGSPENFAADVARATRATDATDAAWPKLQEDRLQSYDLALASDVVYEPHHAILLPMVIERWLKPGGWWAVALAVREEDICDLGFGRLVEQSWDT
ncbi:unnamed protein product [Cladocopium goreaui]|uniref:Calmodulin-lysine N-methyltransferase n=1 Tax=Cladocopium goreaui TaxID=2562237 RepID=A0A9P1BQM0_9DINO|nr:unnamed protein product [Cladocopium goreaui]